MDTYFTLEKAEALLPDLGKVIRDAIELKHFYEEADAVLRRESERIMMSGGAFSHSGPMQAERSRRDTCAMQLKQTIDRIMAFGCEVKDLDIGLIDFRSFYRGEEVYLCWKLGETSIDFWHGIDEGFRGRKPIDDDFRRNHRATP